MKFVILPVRILIPQHEVWREKNKIQCLYENGKNKNTRVQVPGVFFHQRFLLMSAVFSSRIWRASQFCCMMSVSEWVNEKCDCLVPDTSGAARHRVPITHCNHWAFQCTTPLALQYTGVYFFPQISFLSKQSKPHFLSGLPLLARFLEKWRQINPKCRTLWPSTKW